MLPRDWLDFCGARKLNKDFHKTLTNYKLKMATFIKHANVSRDWGFTTLFYYLASWDDFDTGVTKLFNACCKIQITLLNTSL